MRTVKNHAESDLAKRSKINSESFLNFANWRRWEERRLLVSEDGAESKDRVVLVPKVSEGFQVGMGGIAYGEGYRMSAAQWRCLFLSSMLLPRGISVCSVDF